MLIQTIDSEVGITFSTCKQYKEVSYPEVCSYLVKIGASKVSSQYDTEEIIKGIYTFLTNEAYINIVKNDLLSLTYKALLLFSESKSYLQGALNVVGDKDLNKDREKIRRGFIKLGVIPDSKFHKELKELSKLNGKSSHHYKMTFSSDSWSKRRVEKCLDYAIEINLARTLLTYLLANCNYRIYHQLDYNDYWYQVGPVQDIFVYKRNVLIFDLEDTKVIVTVEADHAFSEAIIRCVVGNGNVPKILESLGDKVHLPIIENTTSRNIYLSPEKYRYRIFPLSSFTYNCNRVLNLKELVEEERVGLLLEGVPGSCKTSFAFSLYEELLRKEGYMMVNISYSSFNDLYNRGLDNIKLLVLVNDADSIQTHEDRAKVLARLESNSGFEKLIIIFTANDISGFDEALLRPGRMDYHLKFSKVMI